MMRETVTRGTAQRAFARPPRELRGVHVAGKTGSLNEQRPFRDHTWFVGYAPAEKPQVVVASVVVNGPLWRVRAPWVAREALAAYFADHVAEVQVAEAPAAGRLRADAPSPHRSRDQGLPRHLTAGEGAPPMNKIVIGFGSASAWSWSSSPSPLAWSGTRRRLRVGRVNGVAELRMPRGHWSILGVLAFLPGAAITGLAVAVDWAPGAETGRWVLAGFFAVAAVAASGYLFGLEARGRLLFSETTIESVGVFTRLTARWTDVVKLTFNPMNNWFFMTLASGKRIYVTEGTNGLGDFAELALASPAEAGARGQPGGGRGAGGRGRDP